MILSSSLIDIATVLVLLHADDARQIGVREGDRVTIFNTPKGTSVRAPVVITETLLSPGHVTISSGVNKRLQITDGDSSKFAHHPVPHPLNLSAKKWTAAG